MSKIQNEISILSIAYKLLTRKQQPLEQFNPTTIRINNFYCRATQLEKFTNAFVHPNELPSFAFVATFKLILQCLSQSNIPSNLMGLIHLSSDFTLVEAQNWLLPTDIEVAVKEINKDEKGLTYLIVTKLYQNGQLTTINSNKMLDKDPAYRPSRNVEERKTSNELSKTIASTVLSLKTAWLYAMMSRDFNPIHLNQTLARKFGLKRALMHGMFNLHFSLKHIAKDETRRITSIKAQFNRPCFLPNQIFLKNYTNTQKYGLFGKDQTERYLRIELEFEPETTDE